MKVLILWSGGVESTSLLKQYLSETQHEIFAHYIRMVNPEGRLNSENQAVIELFPLLSKIRSFNLSFSDISICGGKALPNDVKLYLSIGSMAFDYHKCDKIQIGLCKEDENIRTTLDGENISIPRIGDWWPPFQNMISPLLKQPEKVSEILPRHHSFSWTKKQHIEYLGPLLQFTHSCRRPVTGKPCMKCFACIERNA